jgi:hypothetical protein
MITQRELARPAQLATSLGHLCNRVVASLKHPVMLALGRDKIIITPERMKKLSDAHDKLMEKLKKADGNGEGDKAMVTSQVSQRLHGSSGNHQFSCRKAKPMIQALPNQ